MRTKKTYQLKTYSLTILIEWATSKLSENLTKEVYKENMPQWGKLTKKSMSHRPRTDGHYQQ